MVDRTFQACDYTEAKLEAIFLNTYVWVSLPPGAGEMERRPENKLTHRQQRGSDPKSQIVNPN
jgi:hypothetical protein